MSELTEADEAAIDMLVGLLRRAWTSRHAYQLNCAGETALEHRRLLSLAMGADYSQAEARLLDGWVDPFVHGAKYWVTLQDGSRILMEARIGRAGVVNLVHEELDVVIYHVTLDDVADYTLERADS